MAGGEVVYHCNPCCLVEASDVTLSNAEIAPLTKSPNALVEEEFLNLGGYGTRILLTHPLLFGYLWESICSKSMTSSNVSKCRHRYAVSSQLCGIVLFS